MRNNKEKLIEKIDHLLELRTKVYPVRDAHFDELIEVIEDFSNQLIEEVSETVNSWSPNPELIEMTQVFIDEPVFICGGMKTGTTLLTQLLDSHPSLFVMPGDSHYYSDFRNYKGTNNDLIRYWIQRLINPTGQTPFWFLGKEPSVYCDFINYLQYFLETGSSTFQAVVSAVFCANPKRSRNAKYWVEKTPENELRVAEILEDFPNAKFINILRDPLTNIASVKTLWGLKNQKFRTVSYSVQLKNLLQTSHINHRELGPEAYKTIKYEELIINPMGQMSAVANYLKIEANASLETPTENGVPATANSMFKENRVLGVVSTQGTNEKWKSILTEAEKKQVVVLLYAQSIRNGYVNWSNEAISKFRRPLSLYRLFIKAVEKVVRLRRNYPSGKSK